MSHSSTIFGKTSSCRLRYKALLRASRQTERKFESNHESSTTLTSLASRSTKKTTARSSYTSGHMQTILNFSAKTIPLKPSDHVVMSRVPNTTFNKEHVNDTNTFIRQWRMKVLVSMTCAVRCLLYVANRHVQKTTYRGLRQNVL